MGTETSALARQPPPGSTEEDDYRSFCATLSTSARGRAFLAEYARRNRHADTQVLLATLERLEGRLRADGTALERLRDELRMLLIAIRLARPDIDAGSPLTKAAKLAQLLGLMERRIDAMVEGKVVDLAPPHDAAPVEIERPPLSVVPLADEPELPTPAPASPQPAVVLVCPTVAMPEVTFIESRPPAPAAIAIDAPAPKAAAAAALPPLDPLAPIMALSEHERIALFT